jgi:ribose-phosphate pyrophosphokinase
VVPYFPYSRQSKKKSHRGAITARMLANLMNVAGVNHVITIDLHAHQMQGFFKCPVDNLVAEPLLAKWLRRNIPQWEDTVVVSKNPGGTKRVTSMADAMGLSFGIVTTDRRRPRTGYNSMMNSVMFDSMGTDGTNNMQNLKAEKEEQQVFSDPFSIAPIEQDFAQQQLSSASSNGHPHSSGRRPSRPRAVTSMAPAARSQLVNGNHEAASSPLSRSNRPESISGSPHPGLRRMTTAPGISTPRQDEDGYEDPAGSDDEDEVRERVMRDHADHC